MKLSFKKRKKRLTKVNKRTSLAVLYFLAPILAISTALPVFIQSNFLKGFISVSMVGLFFVIANIFSFFAILVFPKFIRKISNFKITLFVVSLSLTSLLFLSFVTNIWLVLLFFATLTVSSSLIWINMDIFLETFSDNNKTGRIRTLFFTFMNAGWIIAPTLAGHLARNDSYNIVYVVAALSLIPFIVILLKKQKTLDKGDIIYKKNDIKGNFKKLVNERNLKGIFVIALLLQVFYSAAIVFIPIYLHEYIGLSWNVLGIIFSIMLIPFVLIEIPAGIIADKKLGEKEILSLGLFILILSLVLFYSVSFKSAILWGALLFFSRVGAALVESMRESYFFKMVDIEDLDMINLFRTSGPLGYLVGTAIGGLASFFFPIQFIFLFVAIVLLVGFYYIYIIEDTK